MSAKVTWLGLKEFEQFLLRMPKALAEDADPLVEDTTEIAASSLRQSYPLGDTGHLRGGVKVSYRKTSTGIVGIVKSTAPHAHLWEFETQVRATRQGWARGRMPGQFNQGLVGIAVRGRRRLHEHLILVVERAGFRVSGAP